MASRGRVVKAGTGPGEVPAPPDYVLDTHTLYWYLDDPAKLGVAAEAIFHLAEAGHARLIVPAIVVAEIFYLTKRAGKPLLPSQLLSDIDATPGLHFAALGGDVLGEMEKADVPEMHDRIIAAHALAHRAPVVTKDPALREVERVKAVW